MDDLERKLIELNTQLINTYIPAACQTIQAVELAQQLRTSNSDTIIINTTECTDEPDNPAESNCCKPNAIIISEDYTVTDTDYYIGVLSTKPITITLPKVLPNPQQIIIKVQMPAPVGNKKVTVVREDLGELDSQPTYVLQSPFEVIQLFYYPQEWNIISSV